MGWVNRGVRKYYYRTIGCGRSGKQYLGNGATAQLAEAADRQQRILRAAEREGLDSTRQAVDQVGSVIKEMGEWCEVLAQACCCMQATTSTIEAHGGGDEMYNESLNPTTDTTAAGNTNTATDIDPGMDLDCLARGDAGTGPDGLADATADPAEAGTVRAEPGCSPHGLGPVLDEAAPAGEADGEAAFPDAITTDVGGLNPHHEANEGIADTTRDLAVAGMLDADSGCVSGGPVPAPDEPVLEGDGCAKTAAVTSDGLTFNETDRAANTDGTAEALPVMTPDLALAVTMETGTVQSSQWSGTTSNLAAYDHVGVGVAVDTPNGAISTYDPTAPWGCDTEATDMDAPTAETVGAGSIKATARKRKQKAKRAPGHFAGSGWAGAESTGEPAATDDKGIDGDGQNTTSPRTWPDPTKMPTADEFAALNRAANAGDQLALAALRALLDHHPHIWRQVGDLATHAESALVRLICGGSQLGVESLGREIADLKLQLGAPGATKIESLQIRRVIATWLQLNHTETLLNTAAAESQQAKSLLKRQDQHSKQFDAAMKSLVTLRKLLPASSQPVAAEIKTETELPTQPSDGNTIAIKPYLSPAAVDRGEDNRAAEI